MKKIGELEVRHDLIGQVEDQFESILYLLRDEEVHGSVDRQADLLGDQAKKGDLLLVIGVRISTAEGQHAQAARALELMAGCKSRRYRSAQGTVRTRESASIVPSPEQP